MSVCDKKTTCANPIDWRVLLKSCIQKAAEKNADGEYCYYLNIVQTTRTAEDCADYAPAVECGGDYTLEQFLRQIIVIDDCGDPAINLLNSPST